jgi:hypothetical protein
MFARIGSSVECSRELKFDMTAGCLPCLMMDVVHGRLNGSGVGQLGEPYCHCLLISIQIRRLMYRASNESK